MGTYIFVCADINSELRLLPKLSLSNVSLTSFSIMRVDLAAQVLSSTVVNVLNLYGGPECFATTKFCKMMNDFFDCLNVRSSIEYVHDRNNMLQPYYTEDDDRFDWHKNTFLKYLADWKKSVENRFGDFCLADRAKMFLSHQTYYRIQMTVYSIINVVKFLISEGCEFILTERFCQDIVEENFGRQRGLGRRKDNSTIRDFGYNDNILRIQRSCVPVEGNTKEEKMYKKTFMVFMVHC